MCDSDTSSRSNSVRAASSQSSPCFNKVYLENWFKNNNDPNPSAQSINPQDLTKLSNNLNQLNPQEKAIVKRWMDKVGADNIYGSKELLHTMIRGQSQDKLAFLQTIRKTNEAFSKNQEVKYEYGNKKVDVAIFDNGEFKKAIEIKTTTSSKETKLLRKINEAGSQLDQVPDGVDRVIEVDWTGGSSSDLSPNMNDTIKRIKSDYGIKTISVNFNDGKKEDW